jgi:hypothetical protein
MHQDQLSEPSEELAARILARVSFDDRFVLTMLHPHTGPLPLPAYGFQEVVNLLNAPGLQFDLKALAKWVEKVMGDEELAARTLEAIDEGPQKKALLAKALMQERLEQCRAVMEEDTNGE